MNAPLIRFHQLDTLRFFFALVIVFGHIFGFPVSFPKGALAVDFFFLLSGFVLAHFLLGRTVSFTDFTIGRVARLYPLHLLTMLIVPAIYLLTGDGTPQEGASPRMLLMNLTLTHAILPGGWFAFNGPSWSISTEFYANILLLFFICRVRAWRSAAIVSALIYAGLVISQGAFDFQIYKSFGPISIGFARCIAGMMLGYVLYEIYKKYYDEDAPASQSIYAISSLIQLALVVSIGWLLLLPGNTYGNLMVIILSALMILALTLKKGLVADALSWPGVSWLGALSYGVYLWHTPLIYLFERLGFNIHHGTSVENNLPTLFAYFASVIALSGLTYIVFEKPAKRMINQMWRTHKDKKSTG